MTDTAPIPVASNTASTTGAAPPDIADATYAVHVAPNPQTPTPTPTPTDAPHHPQPTTASPARATATQSTTHRALHLTLAILLVTGCAVTGALIAFTSLFVDGFALRDPYDLQSLEQWTTAIGSAARHTTELVIFAALALAAIAGLTIIAAWQRHRLWLIAGSLSTAILALSLFGAATNGYGQLATVITHTHDRIGAVTLVDPDEAPSSAQVAPASPPLTQHEATAEIIRLVTLTAAHTGAPLTAYTYSPPEERVFTPEAPPIRYESCFPDPAQHLGTQATLSFTAPSDADGRIARELVSAWAQAGYPPGNAQRSQSFFGGPRTPIHTASIKDSYTIDGNIHVQITTWCASSPDTSSAPAP